MKSRRALIIGVHPYKSPSLADISGAAADANSLSQMLTERFDFDCATRIGNWTGQQLRELRAKFLEDARDSELVLFYFGGHGVRVDVQTYLVPAGARVSRFPHDFLDQCLPAERLVLDFRHGLPHAKKVFIFDCCRNDARRALEHASEGHALTVTGEQRKAIRAETNELIVHTASLDQEALDASVTNAAEESLGLFVRSLLPILRDPDIPLLIDCLREASKRVEQHSSNHQKPLIDVGATFDDFSLYSEGSPYKTDDAFRPMTFDKNIIAIDVCASSGRLAVATGKDKSEGDIRVFGKRSRLRPLRTIKLPCKAYSTVFTHDGAKLVFGLSDGQVGSAALDDRTQVYARKVASAPINCIDWARRFGWIVACSSNGTAYLLEAETLTEIGRCRHWSSVWCATFHRDGEYFATGSKDGHVRLWKVGEDAVRDGVREHVVIGAPIGFSASVRSVRFSQSGGTLAVGTEDGDITLLAFDPASGELTKRGVFSTPRSARVANRKALLERLEVPLQHKTSVSAKKRLARLKTGPANVPSAVLALDFSPDEHVIACSTSLEGYWVFETATGTVVGGMDSYATKTEDKWPRSNALRYGHRKLFAAVGRKLHVVSF